ncbi:MAG: rod shape-determining protein MreC [Clostridiales bacterium]|nr:rod shape-determining protein MreC [Clostridiales bacterium]
MRRKLPDFLNIKIKSQSSYSSKKKNNTITPGRFLIICTAFCLMMFGISFFDTSTIKPLRFIANYTVVPMEMGINRIGIFLVNQTQNYKTLQAVKEENSSLKKQVDELQLENDQLKQGQYELDRLQELYELDASFAQYEKTAAHVISTDNSNWFSTFVIDKGSNDGIEVDMNVIAGKGLVGIVVATGPDWATVKSIIDDTSSVSAMTESTSDLCFVDGDIEQISNGTMTFTDMENNDSDVRIGDTLITSHVSSKYLPGLIIGYISEIHVDSNNLTRSGFITPAADFKHLREVLIIKQTKAQMDESNDSEPQQ